MLWGGKVILIIGPRPRLQVPTAGEGQIGTISAGGATVYPGKGCLSVSSLIGTFGTGAIGPAETHQATQEREQMAHEMWASYQLELERRGS